MPLLQVFAKDQHHRRIQVAGHGTGRNWYAWQYVADAGMGGFYWNDNPAPPHVPMLMTGGASPCVIVVVHCTNGKGALGHLGGAYSGNNTVLQAAIDMHARLTHPKLVDCIILAGGGGIAADADYRRNVLQQVRTHFGVDTRWPVQNGRNVDDSYTAAMYLPTLHQLALYDADSGLTEPVGCPTTALPGAGYGY